ncbi:MAG TPA: SDR family oxidoreductase [Stellaceae bacterium]|nr:SDR family oxidoreductase [Stellaceae bacterium]
MRPTYCARAAAALPEACRHVPYIVLRLATLAPGSLRENNGQWNLLQDFNVKYVGALRCSRAVIPFMKTAGWGRIINISGGNARNAGNLSGGARNAGLVHMTKTLAVQFGRHGITVNCIHPGTTRTERTPSLLAARAAQLGVSPEEAKRQDFAPDSPRGNAICRMVEAAEVAFVAVFLASDKAWAVSGELVAASGGAGRSVYY